MVLNRGILVATVLAAGCGQSLFDSHGKLDGQPGGGDGLPPTTCPANCLADAGADFDGTPGGMGNHWAYLDDHRNRSWAAMTAGNNELVGADPNNKIAACSSSPGSAACTTLPTALLVSSSGMASPADPSIAYTSPTAQVIQLTVAVFVPTGADQVVRVYRNSREDVLFTGTATAGATLEHALTVDALANDRFFVALVPQTAGATDVGVQFFVNSTGAAFPSTCQMAVAFSAATGTTVDNLCGPPITYMNFTSDTAIPPTLGTAPFSEQGSAATIPLDDYYESASVIDRSGDTTVQFWMKLNPVMSDGEWAFSDMDLDNTGGIGIVVYDQSGLRLEIQTCTSISPLTAAAAHGAYPADGSWNFVRATHTNGTFALCLNGKLLASMPIAAGKLTSTYHPFFAKNVVWTPSGAFFDGSLDDVREFSTALPCN